MNSMLCFNATHNLDKFPYPTRPANPNKDKLLPFFKKCSNSRVSFCETKKKTLTLIGRIESLFFITGSLNSEVVRFGTKETFCVNLRFWEKITLAKERLNVTRGGGEGNLRNLPKVGSVIEAKTISVIEDGAHFSQ